MVCLGFSFFKKQRVSELSTKSFVITAEYSLYYAEVCNKLAKPRNIAEVTEVRFALSVFRFANF